jgi:hypothetical protein
MNTLWFGSRGSRPNFDSGYEEVFCLRHAEEPEYSKLLTSNAVPVYRREGPVQEIKATTMDGHYVMDRTKRITPEEAKEIDPELFTYITQLGG